MAAFLKGKVEYGTETNAAVILHRVYSFNSELIESGEGQMTPFIILEHERKNYVYFATSLENVLIELSFYLKLVTVEMSKKGDISIYPTTKGIEWIKNSYGFQEQNNV
jgi:hypothetical protein